MNGGELRLEIASRPLFPTFATISGSAFIPSVEPSPPKTPTAVCNVLHATVIKILLKEHLGKEE
jgi:hypothetical protein